MANVCGIYDPPVVVRKDAPVRERSVLLSGGLGHEPMHGG